jgi:hypothetical protein
MKSISLLHPFSALAIGLQEEDLYHSHSKSQELASRNLKFAVHLDIAMPIR